LTVGQARAKFPNVPVDLQRPPRIACVCLTEERAPIWPIALTSYLTQIEGSFSTRLFCDTGHTRWQEYVHAAWAWDSTRALAEARLWVSRDYDVMQLSLGDALTFRIERLVCHAFAEGADLVTIWDDDDYAPPDRLQRIATAVADLDPAQPILGGYNTGWFVNLVTLQGEPIDCPWGFWGGSLTFNKVAWEAAGGFRDRIVPGYDRSFVSDLLERRGQSVQRFVLEAPAESQPVAFSHGKNIATWLKTRGEPMATRLQAWMPPVVFEAVKAGQAFLIERRVVPPQP